MKTVGLLFEGKVVQKKAGASKPKQAKKPAASKGAEAKAAAEAGEGDN